MEIIIFIGLYFFIAAVIYFIIYAKAYIRYKKEKHSLKFEYWIQVGSYEDLGFYCIIWPFSILAQLVYYLITTMEKIIKDKIDSYGN